MIRSRSNPYSIKIDQNFFERRASIIIFIVVLLIDFQNANYFISFTIDPFLEQRVVHAAAWIPNNPASFSTNTNNIYNYDSNSYNAKGGGILSNNSPSFAQGCLHSRTNLPFTKLSISSSPTIENTGGNESVQLVPFESVTQKLHELLRIQEMKNGTEPNSKNTQQHMKIAVEGYVTIKRSFGSSLAFIDLVDGERKEDNSPSVAPFSQNKTNTVIQLLLKRQAYDSRRTKSSFTSLMKSLYPGTRIYVEGRASPTDVHREAILLVEYIKIMGLSRNPQHIKGILQRINSGQKKEHYAWPDGGRREEEGSKNCLDLEDVLPALNVGEHHMEKIKNVLLGVEDVNVLFDSDSNAKKLTNNENNNAKNLPVAKIAQILLNHMPLDPNYPTQALQSKKIYKEAQYNDTNEQLSTLPVAPSTISTLPKHVQEMMATFEQQHDSNIGCDPPRQEKEVQPIKESMQEIGMGGQIALPSLLKNNNGVMNETVTITGWVRSRRRFRGSVTVLEIIDDVSLIREDREVESALDYNRVKCVLNPLSMKNIPFFDQHKNEEKSVRRGDIIVQSTVDVYGYLLSPGSQVILEGWWSPASFGGPMNISQEKSPILWATRARLARLSWRPSILRYFLSLVGKNNAEVGSYPFDLDEISNALNLPRGINEAHEVKKACALDNNTEIQWRAAEFSKRLQCDKSRMGKMTDEMKVILKKYSQERENWPLEKDDNSFNDIFSYPYSLKTIRKSAAEAVETSERAAHKKGREGSRWQRAKRPQLEWMKNQIQEVVQTHPDYKARPLNVLDIGGGRGHLANYLASVLSNNTVNVHVVDINSDAVKKGMANAKRRNISVHYTVGDASSATLLNELLGSEKASKQKFDVVVALHACGALSDVALGYASLNEAAFVITPCCFRSNPHLLVLSSNHKMVLPSIWQGVDSRDIEVLKQVAELQGDINTARLAMHSICAIRAKAAQRHHILVRQGKSNPALDLKVRIKEFPMKFSTRNLCLVGKLSFNK